MMQRHRMFFAALLLLFHPLGAPAQAPLNIILSAKPQYSGNSCRAYALALSLASASSPPFALTNARELRTVERDIQARLTSTAVKMKLSADSHVVWKTAVSELTAGRLELVLEYIATPDAFAARVKQLTGVSDVSTLGAVFSAALVRTPVMTSVTRMGKDSYGDGHIVTLYGMSGQPVSPTPMAVLNPAVKVKSATRIACEIDDVPNDDRWSAMVSVEPSYELKRFNGRYLLMWLRAT